MCVRHCVVITIRLVTCPWVGGVLFLGKWTISGGGESQPTVVCVWEGGCSIALDLKGI